MIEFLIGRYTRVGEKFYSNGKRDGICRKKKEKENETNELNNKSRFTLEEYFLTVAGENRSFPLPFQHLSRYRCNASDATFFDVQRARAV